ncbi:MAG TPA: hypothetical protein VG148_01365 [Pyrinomonadaceae bacterium]|nr:hypothetical protein [Pyrinomonadaceae bacterium]
MLPSSQSRRGRGGGRGAAETPPPVRPPGDEILTWAEVSRTHRVRHGVYQKDGRLVSLLTDFGRLNPCYPDAAADEDTILYVGHGRRGDQQLTPPNRALLDAARTGHAVPLFNKLGVGRWQHMGFWRVTGGEQYYDATEQRMLWRFTLKRSRQ